MSGEQVGEAFNEFSRSRRAARGANDGLGLGLSIVRRLTELLGIELEVASREGRGSRFRLLLPHGRRNIEALRRAREDQAVFAQPDLKGRSIIVLDDDPLAVHSLSRELADHGVTVVPAGSAAELARLRPEDAADAAIVDYDLGRELGPEVIEAFLRTTGRHFPLLIVTGSTEPAVLQRLQALGHPWITKPVDPDVLLALVSGLLPRD
jgi:CheY-like chemotaxis protein